MHGRERGIEAAAGLGRFRRVGLPFDAPRLPVQAQAYELDCGAEPAFVRVLPSFEGDHVIVIRCAASKPNVPVASS